MKFFTKNNPVPAAAITLATHKSSSQPILFTTQHGYTSNENEGTVRELKWTIRSIKVTTVRDWPSSLAQIVLSCPLASAGEIPPPLPDVHKYRGGNYPYLTFEDEIRIYAGWIDTPSTPICADLLDEYPIDLCPEGLVGKTDEAGVPYCAPEDEFLFTSDISKPLAPIFWGFIDTVNIVADKGIQCVIQCRDRARIFSDTKIISIPSLQGSFDNKGTLASGNRSEILREVANAAVGNIVSNDSQIARWKEILSGEMEGVKEFSIYTEGLDKGDLKRNQPLEDPAGWLRAAMFKVMDKETRPRFHKWVQRPPYIKNNGAATFQILNRSPMEIIAYLANTEERPTDFFASHVNGDFIFAPSTLDTSGFYDPKRMYRTYFYNNYPTCLSDHPPLANQMIMSMRVASSSLGTYNRYVVVDSETGGGYSDFIENVQLAMEINSYGLENREVSPPGRNFLIYDGSLGSYEGGNRLGAAMLTAITSGRVLTRELSAISITIIGDPSFYPNEAVRVYNTMLHDFGTSINPGTPEAENLILEQQIEWERLTEVDSKEKFEQNKTFLKSFENNPVVDEQRKKFNIGRTITDRKIFPVYKVRSIQHNINTQGKDIGFTTKLEMVADY